MLTTLLVIVAAPAHAAITTTAVTTPSSEQFRSVTRVNSSAAPNVTISGTSDASAPGDQVDLQCYYVNGTGSHTILVGNAVDTDDVTGAWTYTDDLQSLDGQVCVVRAVPASTTPADLAPFHGVRFWTTLFATKTVTAGINTGKLGDWHVYNPQRDAYNDWYSLSSCGLCDSHLNSIGTGDPYIGSGYLWYYNDAPRSDAGFPLGATNFGMIVDGDTAFDAYRANALNVNGVPNAGRELPGYPTATISHTIKSSTRDVTSVEVQPLVMCNADRHTQTPGVACTSLVSTGVTLTRTYTFSKHGTRVVIADAYRSTDGDSHAVQMQFIDTDHGFDIATDPVYLMKWISASLQMFADGSAVATPPSSPWGFLVQHSDVVASVDRPVGTTVSDHVPTTMQFKPGRHDALVHLHQFTVPKTGAFKIRQAYGIGDDAGTIASDQDHFVDLFSLPRISRVRPKDKAKIAASRVRVTGRATDAGTLVRVVVNGRRAKLRSNGKFRITLPLKMGINRIRIRAIDGVGNRTTRIIRITRTA